ncbi:MAG TPA: glycosyltransferase [Pricia sp.]|nr:glycosyltransferase [Pricia sp.]
MLLSIILPVFNAEKYISRCLDSLLHQDLDKTDYEILIMDDGSTDRTYSILQKYAAQNQNIRLFHQSNKGVYSARNTLVKKVLGEYIYFMDADDMIAFNVLGTLLQIAQNLSLDIIGFDSLVTRDAKKFGQNVAIRPTLDTEVMDGYQYLEKNPSLRFEIWWYMVKTSFLKVQDTHFDQNNEFNSDVVFTLNTFARAERIAHIPLTIHCYFQGNKSIMRNKDLNHRRILIKNLHTMIQNFTRFLSQLDTKNIPNKEVVKQNLNYRRNIFVVFFLAKLIRSDLGANIAQTYLQQLKEIGVYPLCAAQLNGFSPIKKIAVNMVLNKEFLLLPTIDLTTLQYNWRKSA